MIMYSFFIPGILFYKNHTLYLIPIDKGICGYVTRGKGIYFHNLVNKEMKNDIMKIYEDMFKKDDIKIILKYEIPPIWELNVFYASVLGLELVRYYISNKNIKIGEIINNVQRILKNNLIDFPLLAYKTKFIKRFDKNFNSKKNIKKINKKYFIISYKTTNYLLKNEKIILKARIEKINGLNSIKFENCSIINVAKKDLKYALEKFLVYNKPEEILVASYYKGGIKFYRYETD